LESFNFSPNALAQFAGPLMGWRKPSHHFIKRNHIFGLVLLFVVLKAAG
jgi:hypothetical protein